jgi:hypothetical protein
VRPVGQRYSAKEFWPMQHGELRGNEMDLRAQVSLGAACGTGAADYLAVGVMERNPVPKNGGWFAPRSIVELCDQSDASRCKADTVCREPELRETL